MTKPKINKKEELVSEETVWDVIRFARQIADVQLTGALTPDMLNARMQEVSFNPLEATETTLANSLKHIYSNEAQLRHYSQDFEIKSSGYKRLISYLAGMLAFDYTYYPKNIKKESELSSKNYENDEYLLTDFFERFDSKYEFSIAVRQMLRNEAYFFSIRESDDRIVLQEMPNDYCKITGRWKYGLLYSFNFQYFTRPGVDLGMYPDFFREKFVELFKKQGITYNPTAPVNERGNSSWVWWVDIPPEVGFCFKLSPEQVVRLPYFVGLFSDFVIQPLMRSLQKNKSIASAANILFGEIGLMNKDTQVKSRDSFSVSPDTLAKFMALVKAAVGDSVKTPAAPLQNVKGIQFPLDSPEMYRDFLQTTLANSGINTNLLFTGAQKPNAIETQLSLNTDEQLMTGLYPMFNRFVEWYVNERTKKFKFAIAYEGTNFYTDRQRRYDYAMGMAEKGIVLPQKISAAIGMPYHAMKTQMMMAKKDKFVDELTPILSAFNMSAEEQKNGKGRPSKKDTDLSESGEQTRSDGSNVEKGGTQ